MTIRRLAFALVLFLLGWVGVTASVMLLSDAAPGAVVIWPRDGFFAALPDGVAVLAATPFSVTVRGDVDGGLGLALYKAGGWLVLPAGLPGCLPLPGG